MAQSRNINIIPNSAITRVHVSQGDIGRTIYFNLYEGSLAYTPTSGDVIKCVGTKPSGLGFTVACTWSGNVVTCVTTEEMTDESGIIDTELVITSSDESTVLGTSNFKLCIEKNPHPDGTTDGNVDAIIPELTLLVNEVKGYAEEIEGTYHAYGSPWVASTVAEMTDTDKIYVYTGSETGYVNGNWYYYNGSAWTSGGVYNSVAVQTDTTLSVSGMAADAEAVGDALTDISDSIPIVTIESANLFDYSTSEIGYYRNASNVLVSNSIFVCTNLIDVSNIDTLYCRHFDGQSTVGFYQVLRYDSDGDFIDRVSLASSSTGVSSWSVTGASYVRFNIEYNASADVATRAQYCMIATFYPSVLEAYEEAYQRTAKCQLIRDSSTQFTITFGDCSMLLFYNSNSTTNSYNWNIGTVSIKDNVVIPTNTDILGPVLCNDNTDYIGGVHGDETTNNVFISVDGKTFNIDDLQHNMYGDSINITMQSDVYDQVDGNQLFTRIVQLEIFPNRILVSNTYKTVTACTLIRATNGGLLASYSDLIESIAFNTDYYSSAPTTTVDIANVNNVVATINTIYGSMTVRNIVGKENSDYSGWLQVFTTETRPRCKVYFDTYKTGSYSLSVGDIINGVFEMLFA